MKKDALFTKPQALAYIELLLKKEIEENDENDEHEAAEIALENLSIETLDESSEEDVFFDEHNVAHFTQSDIESIISHIKSIAEAQAELKAFAEMEI